MALFGGLRREVEEHYFGYREVRLPNPNEYELPDIRLVRYLTSGNKEKAREHYEEIIRQRDVLLEQAISLSANSPINAEIADKLIQGLKSDVNEEGRQHIDSIHAELTKSMRVVYALANIDQRRLGETPPVAQGIAIEAVKEIGEKITGKSDWAILHITQYIFYFARMKALKF
jgi:hypothetical protein